MRTFSPATCGLVWMALATAGCMEVFGIEPPPALSNAHSVYDGATPPPLVAPPRPAKIQEARPPVATVVRVPAGTSILVTCEEPIEPPAGGPRASRDKDDPPPPSPYKPFPYAPRAPSLYHTD